jgi:hypothetical protein
MEWQRDSHSNAAPKETILPANSGRTFSLGTLLLVVTAFSAWLALLVNVPCLAAGSLVFLVPAAAHAVEAIRLNRQRGRPITWGEMITQFLSSLLVTLVVSIFTISLMVMVAAILIVLFEILFGLLRGSQPGSGWEMFVTGVIVVVSGGSGLAFSIFMFWKNMAQ